MSAPHPVRVLPVGPAYLEYQKLSLKHANNFSALDRHLEEERQQKLAQRINDTGAEDDLGVGDEPESEELLSLDPKEWKVIIYMRVSAF